MGHIEFNRQRPRVFHRVVEDWCDLAAQADATEALVRDKGNILTGEPQDGIGRRLAAGAGPDHVAHIGNLMPARAQVLNELDRPAFSVLLRRDSRTRILVHRQRMQGNVRAAPGIGRRRQVVGVDLARHLEDTDRDAGWYLRTAGKPFSVSPTLQHLPGKSISLVCQFLDIMKLVEHEQGFLQSCRSHRCHRVIGQQSDQRTDVVTTKHGAEQFRRQCPADQIAFFAPVRERRQVTCLHLGCIIDARWHPVRDQIEHENTFVDSTRSTWRLEQLDQGRGLGRRQWQRWNAKRGALGNMGTVGLQHRGLLEKTCRVRLRTPPIAPQPARRWLGRHCRAR